jgi:hypothetical protein
MKRIPISWLGEMDASANKVAIQIRGSELLIHSILQKGVRDAHSLSEIQKLTMLHLRQWEKFPARILRSL